VDVDAYLARIGIGRPLGPSLRALADLQLAHLLTVPFENLDIVSGVPISLEREALFDKIVSRNRGGFCYELNGLFGSLLTELGYRVTMLSARTVDDVEGTLGPEYDHLVLRVDLEEPWLVDVGFGDSVRVPVPLRSDVVLDDPLGRAYRLDVSGDDWDLTERPAEAEGDGVVGEPRPDGAWTIKFRFTLIPRTLPDFAATCRWQETQSPWFTEHRFCSIARPDGRLTLMDDRLITRSGAERTERPVDEADVRGVLRDRFGFVL